MTPGSSRPIVLIADPELLHGIPEAWSNAYPTLAERVEFCLPASPSRSDLVEAAPDADIILRPVQLVVATRS